jgi:hypothetical protein
MSGMLRKTFVGMGTFHQYASEMGWNGMVPAHERCGVELKLGKEKESMKMSRILLAVIALIVLAGAAVPSHAAVRHHHRHHHHRHA